MRSVRHVERLAPELQPDALRDAELAERNGCAALDRGPGAPDEFVPGALFGRHAAPHQLPVFLGSVFAGALLGTWLGVERLPRPWLLRTLGAVLTVAGTKLLFT